MNKIFRLGLIVMLLGLCMPAFAQKMSIESFELLENDLDASTFYPKKDFNNRTSAILKIFTTEKDFSIDNGALGIVEVVYKTAEVWVYVPENTTKLKITHPKLGHLKNAQSDGYYWFNTKVKSGKSYKILLATAAVEGDDEDEVKTGWFVLNSVPEGADVYLSQPGEEEKHYGTTPFNMKLQYADYHLRVKKYNYHDGMALVKMNQDRVTMDIDLKPAFGSISVTSNPTGASVFMNGKDTNKKTPCVLEEVPSGECNIRVQYNDYAPATRTIEVEEGKTTSADFVLDARFAQVTINSLLGAIIKIDGKVVGTSSYTGDLKEGIHDVNVSLASHETVTKQFEVVAKVAQTIEVKPIPRYGELDVVSNPVGATVTIDGESYGDTPRTIKELLEGEYTVVFSKQGYASETRHVTISKGNPATLNVQLTKGREVSITTGKEGDIIYVDGNKVGVSPFRMELTYGEHKIEAEREGRKAAKTIYVAQGSGNLAVEMTIPKKAVETAAEENDIVPKVKKAPLFRFGVEGDILWGPENSEDSNENKLSANLFTGSIGVALNIGRQNKLLNFNVGARYRYTQDSYKATYSYYSSDYKNHYSGEAKYSNTAHEIVTPAILKFNFSSYYVGVGYEHGFLLSQKEEYTPTEGNSFNKTEYDEYLAILAEDGEQLDVRQMKFPSRAILLQGGFNVDKIDVKLTFKVDLASKKTVFSGGVGVGYYF